MSREVYGYVYGLVLRDWHDDRPPYIGKVVGRTEAAITRRVHGTSASAHTSAQSVARDPWKAHILPGRQGWIRLEVVRSCGDRAEDDRALRRAEADWIHRRNPVHNDVRPIRQGGTRPSPRPVRKPAPPARPTRRRRRLRPSAYVLLLLMLGYGALAARVTMGLPNPAAPWVIAPVAGVALGNLTFHRLHRAYRRHTR